MKSMTSFGYSSQSNQHGELSFELKSYNSKFLDIHLHLPAALSQLEPYCREALAHHFMRGKVELNCRFKVNGGASFNSERAEELKVLLAALTQHGFNPSYSLGELERFGLFQPLTQLSLHELGFNFEDTLAAALNECSRFKQNEGGKLKTDILQQLNSINLTISAIEAQSDEAEKQMVTLLKKKFNEVMGNLLDERRILEETAAYIVKTNINEEIVRLKSHSEALAQLIEDKNSGKRIDFLCQELGREANTIGSKTPALAIQRAVLIIKENIDKIKEQARNVE
ncbi:MAG: YicC family protein [Spirochaetaceae bacterium]|nr:YicC family protein [Spirochaetaceae bacterium]